MYRLACVLLFVLLVVAPAKAESKHSESDQGTRCFHDAVDYHSSSGEMQKQGFKKSSKSEIELDSKSIRVKTEVSGTANFTKQTQKTEDFAFPVDFSTTESALRTRVFQGDVEGAASVLQSSRVVSLAAGMTYPPELSFLVQKSEDRNEDPDVVAFKALAMSALQTGDAKKLADVLVLSFRSDCQCSVLSSAEADDLREAFAASFSDRDELFKIVTADANKDLVHHRRRLQVSEGSPTNSFGCAYCWPGKVCRPVGWCKPLQRP